MLEGVLLCACLLCTRVCYSVLAAVRFSPCNHVRDSAAEHCSCVCVRSLVHSASRVRVRARLRVRGYVCAAMRLQPGVRIRSVGYLSFCVRVFASVRLLI